MKITFRNLPFLLVDIASFYLALLLALVIRLGSDFNWEVFKIHLKPFLPVLLIFLLTLYVLGLYDLKNFSKLFRFFRLLLTGLIVVLFLSTAYFYLSPSEEISPKLILAIFGVTLGIINYSFREILRRYLMKSQPLSNVLLIGDGEDVRELYQYIEENPQMGFGVAAWVKAYDILEIQKALRDEPIEVLVVPHFLRSHKEFTREAYQELLKGRDVIGFSEFYENILGKISMDALEENWFLEKIKPKNGLYPTVKRILDLVLALGILLVTLPFWPIVVLGIRLSSKGPTFFLKERIGLNEEKFLLFKFRTMHPGADETNQIQDDFAKERGDETRVFAFGRWLRRLRIDEWPQVLNVLKGELAFVGPRADFIDYYNLLKIKIPYYQIRTVITPGLSGWAQIHDQVGSSVDNARERLAYDIYYIKNRSFVLDIAITLKTLKTILTFSGV